MTPEKKRKVLSDIGNVELPKNRRKSLGFDMASIGGEEEMHSSSESNIPDPPPSRLLAINSLADMHMKSSNIPVINKHRSFHSLMAVKDSLNAKSKLPSGFEKWKEPPKLEPMVDAESLQNDKRMLDRELRSSQTLLEQLEVEFQEKRRLYRVLEKQSSDARFRLRHLESRFELKGNTITQHILHEELAAELLLRELENRLEDEFNKQKFQLRNEIMDAGNFEDTQALEELESLAKRKEELEKKLEETIAEKDEAIRKEIETNKEKLAALRLENDLQLADVRQENEKKQAHLDQLESKFHALNEEKLKKEAELEALETDIKNFRDSANNVEASTEQLEETLRQKEEQLASLRNDTASWIESLRVEREKYEAIRKKYDNYLSVHRTLEDAIMSFDPHPRTYVRIPAGLNVSIDDEKILTVDRRLFQFSRIFHRDDDLFPLQWEVFVQRALIQHNVTLLFIGSSQQDMFLRLLEVFTFLRNGEERLETKGWTFSFSLQCSSIKESSLDLLNPSAENKFHYENGKLVEMTAERVNISGLSDLEQVLKNFQAQPGAVTIYFIQIQAVNERAKKAFTNQLSLVDLTNKSFASQVETISLKSSKAAENNFFTHVKKNTRSLYVCEVDEIVQDTLPLLSSISHS